MLNLFSELWFSSSSFQFSNKKTRSRSWNQDVETNSNHIISTYRQSIRQKEKGSSTRQTDRQTDRQTSRPIDRQIRIQKPNLRSASKEVFSSVHNGYLIRCALACSTHFCLHPEDVQCTPLPTLYVLKKTPISSFDFADTRPSCRTCRIGRVQWGNSPLPKKETGPVQALFSAKTPKSAN